MTHLDFFLTENKQKTSESMADMLQTVYEFPACVKQATAWIHPAPVKCV